MYLSWIAGRNPSARRIAGLDVRRLLERYFVPQGPTKTFEIESVSDSSQRDAGVERCRRFALHPGLLSPRHGLIQPPRDILSQREQTPPPRQGKHPDFQPTGRPCHAQGIGRWESKGVLHVTRVHQEPVVPGQELEIAHA